MTKTAYLLCVLSMVICIARPAAGVQRYTITDLNVPIAHNSDLVAACDLNNKGQVVGWAGNSTTGVSQGWWYSNGATQSLTTVGSTDSYALSINDTGIIVGSRGSGSSQIPCLWTDGQFSQPEWLRGGTEACVITNGGVAGGCSEGWGFPPTPDTPCTWDSTGMHSYSTLVGDISDITENGLLVVNDGRGRAYLIKNGVAENLASLGGMTAAWKANESGTVVGNFGTYSSTHACAWIAGLPHDLDVRPGGMSMATDINESGAIVGCSLSVGGFGPNGALIWSDGVVHNLADLIPMDSGWTLNSADALNDSGQIVGTGVHNGRNAAFILTPVPEPSSVLALFVGLAGVPLMRRKR